MENNTNVEILEESNENTKEETVTETVEKEEVIETLQKSDEELAIEQNKNLENYEEVYKLFTDILTNIEVKKLETETKDDDLLKLGKELMDNTIEYSNTENIDLIYKTLKTSMSYLATFFYTFNNFVVADEKTYLGVLTKKIDIILNDLIGDKETIEKQYELFSRNFKDTTENENNHIINLKIILNPIVFNLSNISTIIACIKTIIYYLEKNMNVDLKDILTKTLEA